MPAAFALSHERELVEVRDAEERRRVRRVEHLVAALGERPKQAIDVPLGLRAEVQLGLLDQHDEPAHACLDEALDGAAQVGRRVDQLDRPRGPRVRCDGDEVAAATRGGQEDDRRRALPVQVQGRGRAGVEEEHLVSREPLEPDPAAVRPLRDVARVGNRRTGLEQHPDRREHGRLAA